MEGGLEKSRPWNEDARTGCSQTVHTNAHSRHTMHTPTNTPPPTSHNRAHTRKCKIEGASVACCAKALDDVHTQA
jgi:hypothetical protein